MEQDYDIAALDHQLDELDLMFSLKRKRSHKTKEWKTSECFLSFDGEKEKTRHLRFALFKEQII